jgi:hypothetical protein
MSQPDRHFDNLDSRAENPPATLLGRASRICLALIIVGGIGSLFGWLINPVQFHFSYLVAWTWGWAVLMGLLFFVMLHHLVDAGWSTVVRRPAEAFLAAMPILTLLFIPVLIGVLAGTTHSWVPGYAAHAPVATEAHVELRQPTADAAPAEAKDKAAALDDHAAHLLHNKQPYLNVPFFLARQLLYFTVWLFLAWKLRRNSLLQDAAGASRYTLSSRRVSAVGILFYGLTVTFAAFDWLMSLDWHWFSTIYGVYTWAGAVLAGLAALTLATLALSGPTGPLRQYVGSDTRHDLGKLLFAFSVFWAYIAFSQWFLVWYGNIPEETMWYLKRWTGAGGAMHSKWWVVSLLLPIGRFLLPFFIMMSAHMKRHPRVLAPMSILALAFAWVDLYWLAMPSHELSAPPLRWLWIDLSSLALIIGCCGVMALKALRQAPLYPIMDPRLVEALSAEHVEEIGAADID